MKRFYIILIALFLVNGAIGQSDHPCVPCLPQGITFTTQSQIDNFQSNYPNCTQIEGYVQINGSDISNLNGLSVLTSIGGSLDFYYNPVLTNLTGMDGLTSIGGFCEINNNPALNSLTGLGNLASIGGSFSIRNNPALTSLTGLENLTNIGGMLEIYNNDALTSITALGGVSSISSYLWIYDNVALNSLTGLEGLTTIGGILWIEDNDALINLTGLDNVTSIVGEGYFGIRNNPALTSLMGLEDLISIGGDFSIQFNPALTSLTGLGNLTSIGGKLELNGNNTLTSLTGLDNIAAGSISDLSITGNLSLSSCAVQSICDYLANPNGYVEIGGNATGCNSQEEVDSACAYLTIGGINLQGAFKIYPNPSSGKITISYPAKGHLSILNLNGQQVLQREITEPTTTIDVSGFKSGVYFVRVTGEKGVSYGKFIKR